MHMQKSVFMALLSLAASAALVVPQMAQAQAKTAHVPLPHELLKLNAHHASGPQRAIRAAAVPGARVYRFATADYPGTATSLVFDENASTVLGDSQFSVNEFSFTLHNGLYQELSVPNSLSNEATGINTAGEIVGIYSDFSSVQHGFLDNGGVFTNLDITGGITEPFDINDSGEIIGTFIDGSSVSHGFYTLDNGASYTLFDMPGATGTTAAGVNSSGTIVGPWTDASSNNHGFIDTAGTFTSLDVPGATSTVPIGINDSGEIAGYYEDSAGVFHGFIYSNGAFTTVDVVGATDTQLTRIKNKGQITGTYSDSMSESHGLTGH